MICTFNVIFGTVGKDKMIYQELFESVYNAEYITGNQYFVNDVTSEIV